MVEGESPEWHGLHGLAAQNLSPAYFAIVMATGIVSIAAFMLGMASTSMFLFAASIACYVVLVLLSILRFSCFPKALVSDFVDHQRGPGFFTFVAGSCVLGSQFVLIAGNYDVAFAGWAATFMGFAATMARSLIAWAVG